MVKVLDPDGIIIGVYESAADVPERVPNRSYTYWYLRKELFIIEVTELADYQRLLPSLIKGGDCA